MLSSVSWYQYIVFLVIATVLWYLFIWLIIYRGKFPIPAAISRFRSSSFQEDYPADEMARYIMDEIGPLLTGKNNKAEIMLCLRQTLSKYAEYTEPGFREAINQFIFLECQSKCSIRLSEEDQRVLWL